jgi:hypothetical protein
LTDLNMILSGPQLVEQGDQVPAGNVAVRYARKCHLKRIYALLEMVPQPTTGLKYMEE